MKRTAILLALALLPSSAVAQQRPRPDATPEARPAEAASGSKEKVYEVAGAAEEKVSSTSHVTRIDGREIKYTATAGTLPIRLEDGKLAARMFFVAYTKDGENPRTRPVSFLFNGGPGSASVWLHLGSFAPKKVRMAGEGFQPAPPYELVDNEFSLLDASDVVFVDAISTGYSRTVAGVDPTQFHGVKNDIKAFAEFLRGYLDGYDRWPSPKFLIGESYGTIRSAGLSQELQTQHGIELNGVVLLSALLSYQTLQSAPNNDVAFAAAVPTYTATAWYHKKLPAELSGSLEEAVAESRAFAWGEYTQALTRGNTLDDAEKHTVAQKLSRLTGVSAEFVEQANLRVSPARYRKELLRDQRLVVGRLDSRFTAYDLDAAGEQPEFDPSNTALQGAYVAAFNDYIRPSAHQKLKDDVARFIRENSGTGVASR